MAKEARIKTSEPPQQAGANDAGAYGGVGLPRTPRSVSLATRFQIEPSNHFNERLHYCPGSRTSRGLRMDRRKSVCFWLQFADPSAGLVPVCILLS